MTTRNETGHLLIALSSDDIDIINHCIRRTYLFDGWDLCVSGAGALEAERVAALLVRLGYPHPRTEDEEDDE